MPSSTSPPKLSLLPSPMLSLAPAVDPSESPRFTTSLDSPGSVTPQEPSDDGAQAQANEQQLAGVSYMTKKRTGVIEKVAEVKKKLQESSMSGVGEEVATEEQVAERLASFKKMVEELDVVSHSLDLVTDLRFKANPTNDMWWRQLEKELEQVLAMGDSFHVWQSQKRRLVEITPQGQVVSCDLLYRSPFVNDWGPITQQFNFKGSLLSSGPTYAFCKVKMVTKDGRQVDNLQDASVDDLLYEVKLANAIRYIDEIKSFGTADKSTPRKGAENVVGGMGFKIEWKSGTREQWHAEDGEGFERVLSYHMRAYSLRRSKQVGRLRGLWCLACTPYDSADKQHEEELMALWQAVCPDTQLTDRVTPQWKQIGFQGNDPATDFRGMGLLGLTTILYFARHHGDTLSALLKQGRSYPWASTGINLTQMLFKSLKLDEALIRAADSSERWDTPLFHFMTTKDNEEERSLFEEVFCQCFLLFDRIWVGSNAGYMDFPVVLNKVSQVFEEILLQRPKDIADLHRRQQVAVELQAKPQS
ncbi:ELMO/CED12 family protein [Acanthamoeba castellanii str. Neff]|uniref:ELMO/CED12 family protein n=1 Tax=Acanthamoeba castellanii (strain ATCC 30010 / Neff) TaxID=1257118 RepID=L8GY14_ACACF|nr:ELMO/CED12 family protein [Acanthamoeba castellanii str. Neff]ELR18129.1 ELMO/CED12 family protein [Acanthamoeba castellanii str. Neff]